MLQDFKEFIFRGNAFAMAIGVIMGGAFGKIVDAVVNYLIMPIVGAIGNANFDNYFIALSANVTATNLVDAQKQGAVFAYGAFLTVLVSFLIIASILFLLVKIANRFLKAKSAAEEPAAATVRLLTDIRNMLREEEKKGG